MKYHPLTEKIVTMLKAESFWFETFEHEPVRTSEEAAKIRTGYTLNQGAKAIIIRVKFSSSSKEFVMLVIPGDKRFNSKKAKSELNAKDIRFATEDEVLNLTNGVLPGGVPPFGSLFNLSTFVDPSLFENEKIVFNAGDRSFSIGMLSKDYQTVENPQ
ncbi:hypothetical protein KC660_02975, partial [Candidatus Dojkabacteria bacterium]|nr:hypothetical protein [Candidatus Dojkabacteria bacterium]